MSILSQASIHAWIQENGILTESGVPLDFSDHKYLFDVYADNSKYLCCIKAGQIGFSTMAILKTIWLARNRKLDVGYILPTVEMVQKFVGSKVNRMAQQNPIIQQWMKDKDSITQKQIDQNYIHYLGAQTERSAIMLSLDMLVADEYDKAPQSILETYDSRLQHSKHGIKWVFSNPTIPDFGVDRFWSMSDKKKWHITHSCGETYVMDESCIDYKQEKYICPLCKGDIVFEEIRQGKWIATSKGEWSGYWIPLWINPNITAKTIAEKKRNNTKEYFANFVAGEAYVNPTDALSQAVLEKCLTSEPNSQEGRVIIGIDSGHNLHYTMVNKQGLFYNGYCPSVEEMGYKPGYDPYDEIERRMIQYPNSIVMADQGGDLIGIRKLQAKYPGRVFLVWSVKETRTQQLIRWGENDEYGKVLIDRNRVMQLAVDQINDGRTVINGTKEDWQPFFTHALNIYRVKETKGDVDPATGIPLDPQYGWKWVWKRKGPDHLFLSFIYAMVGMDRYAEDLAQIVSRKGDGIPLGADEHGIITGRRLGVKAEWN